MHLAERNVPWLRYIWIVTQRPQRPSWLPPLVAGAGPGRIRVVHHDEFMSAAALPTYNSLAIECYLPRIAGLAEHWLYSNDDTMILQPTHISDFYGARRRPIFRTVIGADRRRKLFRESVPVGHYRVQHLLPDAGAPVG